MEWAPVTLSPSYAPWSTSYIYPSCSHNALESCLKTFHNHKKIIIKLEIREHFNIPKLHALLHYINCIRPLGSADGYNTESPERLHIDFAKEAYRASNKRDYVEQMAVWLQRHEAVWLRESYLVWVENWLDCPRSGLGQVQGIFLDLDLALQVCIRKNLNWEFSAILVQFSGI